MLSHHDIREEMIRQMDAGTIRPRDVADLLKIPSARVAEMRKRTRRVQHDEMQPLASLLGMSDGQVSVPRMDATDQDDDPVEIDSIDLSFGMGGSFVDYEPGALEVVKAKFSRDWLRKFTHTSPELLFTTSGVGDSMTPTINDQDLVIVDRSENRLDGALGEKIWAIVYGGVGMIKRLRPQPDGTVKIMSDNQLVRDELATDSDLFVIGRVVASVRRQ